METNLQKESPSLEAGCFPENHQELQIIVSYVANCKNQHIIQFANMQIKAEGNFFQIKNKKHL